MIKQQNRSNRHINRNNTGTEKSERNCHSQKYIPVRRQNMVG